MAGSQRICRQVTNVTLIFSLNHNFELLVTFMKTRLLLLPLLLSASVSAQNPLAIPSTITSSTIQLTLDEGTTQFFPGINTPTMGANGSLLGPTLILQQGNQVSIEVNNQLADTTTLHWHGLHVAPENDGGPHTTIPPNTVWNPQFTVLDKAGLYWYHPHMHMHTDEHVSRGIAGLIIVRDNEEAGLGLPMTYGVDEFPLVFQTKGFAADGQILIHTNYDTTVMVNGTLDATTTLPAQVVRLRMLNGSTQRVMEIGFSDNRSFQIIGTDGGLLTAPVTKTRYRLAPGQRIDVLVDLSTSLGQQFQLMSYGAEIPNAHYGAAQPGMGPGATSSLVGYTSNPLNGANYALLDITVGAQTASPVTTIPATLANFTPIPEANAVTNRSMTFTSMAMGNLNGPFMIDGMSFDMHMINYTIPLNSTEIWTLTNQTPIAHPFHIHDVQFFILDINGVAPPAELQGYHDVVLVPAGMGTVRFITIFADHSNDSVPYMFHCHMLTHEDDGMMGQFLVTDQSNDLEENTSNEIWSVFPNPGSESVFLKTIETGEFIVFDTQGKQVFRQLVNTSESIEITLEPGIYFVHKVMGGTKKLIIRN